MSCTCGKAAYESEREARSVARELRKREGRKLKPYLCPRDSTLWHLTSQGKARRPAGART